MTTVRIIMAIVVSKGWLIRQMDVKNAFLHGDLQEKLYMTPPPGLFSSSSTEVCHLKRSIYGLKQAPQAWFEKFRTTLLISPSRKASMTTLSSFRRLILGSFYFLYMSMIL